MLFFHGGGYIFFHGGGYIFGHIDLFDGPVSRYTSASGVPMLSVDYRRAPEHPFPTPLEDAGRVRAENPVTVSEQHVPGGRPRQYRLDESQDDRALWPSDSST